MYYHHLSNLIVLFLILPSLVELTTNIQSDVLILPNVAQTGFVLLEETKPSRYHEFEQCYTDNDQLNIHIDEKYGDLILNQTIESFDIHQQKLLCTVSRNQVSEREKIKEHRTTIFFSFIR